MRIRNLDKLTGHGNQRGRRLALEILQAGLDAADTYRAVRSLVRLEGHVLHVGGRPELDVSGWGDQAIDLDTIRNIYVLGAGKAVQQQALALEHILGDRLTAGAVTVKYGEGAYLDKIEVTQAAHPVPDENGIVGARKIVAMAQAAQAEDLVFTLFSDGASSLFPLPTEGFDLEDVRAVYRLTIKYGPQYIIHRIMKYFSAVNCGRIIRLIHPARTINFVMQTGLFPRWRCVLPAEGCWVHSWPPPVRSYAADVRAMQDEEWWVDVPPTMRAALERLDPQYDVPDLQSFCGAVHSYWQPVDTELMMAACRQKAEELGVRGAVLGGFWIVPSCEAAKLLTGIARHIVEYGEPFRPPVALISSGELIVPVGHATGIGGRNQEFVLCSAASIGDEIGRKVIVAAMDTDGTDGPGTQWAEGPDGFECQAGGLADGETLAEARLAGIDIDAALRNHNSSIPLWQLDSAIITGNTGTAQGDLRIVLVLE